MQEHDTTASDLETAPSRGDTAGEPLGEASVRVSTNGPPTNQIAAEILIEHLFANTDAQIPGIAYAVAYRLAEEFIGGDIIDVYQFDNNSVAFTIADILERALAPQFMRL